MAIDKESLLIAFVQGAKWWEWQSRGATMWQNDQALALKEAERKLEEDTLGKEKEYYETKL